MGLLAHVRVKDARESLLFPKNRCFSGGTPWVDFRKAAICNQCTGPYSSRTKSNGQKVASSPLEQLAGCTQLLSSQPCGRQSNKNHAADVDESALDKCSCHPVRENKIRLPGGHLRAVRGAGSDASSVQSNNNPVQSSKQCVQPRASLSPVGIQALHLNEKTNKKTMATSQCSGPVPETSSHVLNSCWLLKRSLFKANILRPA